MMARHFGVLIPSTNTTVEMECRLLPPAYQAHVGRLMTSTPGQTFSPSRDEDIDYQSRLLGTASRRRSSGDHLGAGGRPCPSGVEGASHRDRFALFRRGQ
jgi:hypothetical protein